MGKIENINKSGGIQITYGGADCPFTGIDSLQPPTDIAPAGQISGSAGFIPLNNSLSAVDFEIFSTGISLPSSSVLLGTGSLEGNLFALVFDTTGFNLTLYTWNVYGTEFTQSDITNLPLFSYTRTAVAGSLTYKNVNGICYFSFWGCPYILSHNNTTISIVSNWLGCAYLSELNGRLVAGHIFQVTQSLPNVSVNTTPSTESISAVAPQFNLNTTTGADMVFASEAIAAGDGVNVVVNFNFTINSTFPGGSNPSSYYCDVYIQLSTDTGSTWQNIYSFRQYTYSYPTVTQSITYDLSSLSLANLDTVMVRGVVDASGADLANQMTVYLNITNVTGNIIQAPVTPVYQEFPFQFAWSAGANQFSIWNTIGTGGLVTGAGYDNLPDVEDAITGFIMTGPTCFVLRKQGITEVTPLNSGIQPFEFDHFWASHSGIGTPYGGSVAQYGATGKFISSDDIYSFGYGGLTAIGGSAKSEIYKLLINDGYVYNFNAVCGFITIDGWTSQIYVVTFIGNDGKYYIYLYLETTQQWYRLNLPTGYSITDVAFYNFSSSSIPFSQFANVNGLAITCSKLNSGTGLNDYFNLHLNITSGTYGNTSQSVILRAEEVMFYRDVTIDAIVVYGIFNNLDASFSLATSINGVAYTTLNSTNVTESASEQFIALFPATQNAYTGKNPQISMSITQTASANLSTCKFSKIVAFGSFDPTQRPV